MSKRHRRSAGASDPRHQIDDVRPAAYLRGAGAGARILGRPRHLVAERFGGVQRPVRVAQEFARQQDLVGLATAGWSRPAPVR